MKSVSHTAHVPTKASREFEQPAKRSNKEKMVRMFFIVILVNEPILSKFGWHKHKYGLAVIIDEAVALLGAHVDEMVGHHTRLLHA